MQLLQACKEDLLKLDEEDENAEEGLSLEQRFFFFFFPSMLLKSLKHMKIVVCPCSVGNSCRGSQLPLV